MTDPEELVRRLRPIVEAATPGPRRMYNGWGEAEATRVERIGSDDVTVFECSVNSDICARKADFEYIAALDPETVSALLDTIERLSSDLAAAQKEIHHVRIDGTFQRVAVEACTVCLATRQEEADA